MTTASSPVHVLVPQVAAGGEGHGAPVRVDDPRRQVVPIDDLGWTRGDGIFETIGVFAGRALALEPHLARLQRSATMLDLPQLDLGRVREALRLAVDAHRDAGGEAPAELNAKIMISRGRDGSGVLTCWVVAAVPAGFAPQRQGLAVLPLSRGTRSDVLESAPWLLPGAKTLSYAVNMAMLREAARRGFDDVLMTSSDGLALEGPTSSLVIVSGGRWLSPDPALGILPGTTQAVLFELLAAEGADVGTARLGVEDVQRAEGAWLVSSGRLLAPITRLADAPLPVDLDATRALEAQLVATAAEI
jgi:4-amino-4-deoxychorismate lyase